MADVPTLAKRAYAEVGVSGSRNLHLANSGSTTTICGYVHTGKPKLTRKGLTPCRRCNRIAYPPTPKPFGLRCTPLGCDTAICCWCGIFVGPFVEVEPDRDPHTICVDCFPQWYEGEENTDALIILLFGTVPVQVDTRKGY